MIDVRELSQLYSPDNIGVSNDVYNWTEKQNSPTMLYEVEFRLTGSVIGYISSNLLKTTQNAYNHDATQTLNLKKICDGVLFLESGGQNYIAILEVKSGFKEVKKHAIEQIPASYLKTMSVLNDFSSFNKKDYKIFGLIVSYPYIKPIITSSANNATILAGKQAITGNALELLKIKYNVQLRDCQQSDFNGKDFLLPSLTSVKPELLFNVLPVRHCPVPNHCGKAVVDLNPIIASL